MKTILIVLIVSLIQISVCRRKNKRDKTLAFQQQQNKFRLKQQEQKGSVLKKKDRELAQKQIKQRLLRFKQQSLLKQKQKQKEEPDEEQPQTGVLKKGWLKFLIFDPREGEALNNFFVNNAYFEEKKRKQLKGEPVGEADEYGPQDIPNQYDFFFVLTKDQLLVLSQRHNDLMKTQQIVYLNNIANQKVGGGYEGGIEDQGNFKEGFCFKLNVANERLLVWVLCAEDIADKTGWMEVLAEAKLKQQMVSGIPDNEDAMETDSQQNGNMFASQVKSSKQSKGTGKGTEGTEGGGDKKDGYWIILQDWSTCTLACGGGTQTLHRFCVPEQGGGKPCKGEAQETKECNTEPCPQDSDELLTAGLGGQKGVETEQKTLPTKIKMMRVSKRMKRYERCVLKEGDMNLMREDLKTPTGRVPQVQSRVVMNNLTFSVFENDQYQSQLFGQLLKDIKIRDFEQDPQDCLVVIDKKQGKRVVLCGIEDKTGEKKDWLEQIKFFKENCVHQLLPGKGKLGEDDETTIKEDPLLSLKKQEMDEELAEKKQEASEANQDQQEVEQEKLKNSLQDVQKMAIDAMQQELKYESRMEKEEQGREKRLDQEMRQKLEQMKEKEECVKRNIRKNQQKAVSKDSHNDIAAKIQQIKESIRNMIISNREKHKEKLQVMRKISERKRQQQNKEIQEIKIKVAGEVVDQERKGDKTICLESDESKQQDNCKGWYTDEIELKECFQKSYCEMCCEKEFGDNNIDLRMDCMGECVKQDNEKASSSSSSSSSSSGGGGGGGGGEGGEGCGDKKDGGNWVWVPESNSVKAF